METLTKGNFLLMMSKITNAVHIGNIDIHNWL